jgi:hypothetical protein
MKRSELYEEAAERLDGGYDCGCCAAIYNANPIDSGAERAFAELFRPDNATNGVYWWDGCCCEDESTRGPRVLALCFMAAIAADEELSAV